MSDPLPGTGPATALRTSLDSLIAESQALRADVQSAEEARRRVTTINLGLLGLLILFVGLLVAIGWQGNRAIEETRQVNKQLADCTTPGGKCYQEGQARQAQAISAVTRISVFVSQCGRLWPGESGPDYDRKLNACVAERLAEAAGVPSAAPAPTPSASRSG